MTRMKLLLYCEKAIPYLYRKDDDSFELSTKIKYEDISDYKKYYGLNNGKIVAECDYEVEEIFEELYGDIDWQHDYLPTTNTMSIVNLERESCLSREELYDYCNGYAIHIKNLHIFDEPRELSNYHISYFNKEFNMMREKHIEKAPRNMCRAFDIKDNYILISIQPQWLCKILNGEKTVEIRKKVLKGML